MAKQEGWFSKTGSKWQTMPDQMLIYRAYSFFARAYCPDKLLGIHDEFENLDITKIEQKAENPFIKEEADILDIKKEFDKMDVIELLPEKTEEVEGILVCENCGAEINQKVYDYSMKKYNKALCYSCQKKGE